MSNPICFNYQDYLDVVEENKQLNKQLKEEINKLLKLFEDTCKNCGSREYEGISQQDETGGYYNECPGFDDDNDDYYK